MSKSQHLRDKDIRRMLRLMGEVAEVPAGDRQARAGHLLRGLCRIAGARAGTFVEANHRVTHPPHRPPEGGVEVVDGMLVGIDDRSETDAIARYLQTLWPVDPLSEPLYGQQGKLVVRRREQLMPRDRWHRSEHFNEVRRAAGIDDCVAAKIVVWPGQPRVQTVCIHRALRDRTFGPRQSRMVRLLLQEGRRLLAPPPPHQSRRRRSPSPRGWSRSFAACLPGTAPRKRRRRRS
jgi:hypothetical protein